MGLGEAIVDRTVGPEARNKPDVGPEPTVSFDMGIAPIPGCMDRPAVEILPRSFDVS